MISDKDKCIFIHAPKCAGESIETVFTGKALNISEYEGHPEKHWGVKEISRAYPRKFESYFKFTVIRNPWDRVISWVKYRDKRFNRVSGNFEERLLADLKDKKYVGFMLRNSYQNLLYLNGKLSIDYIIKMEQLQTGFDSVCDILGRERVVLPHCNRTTHDHYSKYYNDEIKALVSVIFADDISNFGYRFKE